MGTRIRGVRVGTAGALGWEDHIKGQACLVCKRNSLLPEPPYALPPCCPEAEVISPSHTSSSAGPFKRTTPASHRSAGGAPVAPAGGGACAASTAPAGRRCRAPARSGVRAASRASAPSPARSDAPAAGGEAATEAQHGEFGRIIANKGAGKSTWIERFFRVACGCARKGRRRNERKAQRRSLSCSDHSSGNGGLPGLWVSRICIDDSGMALQTSRTGEIAHGRYHRGQT